ncbi:tail fiber assembly protein [Comamonas thiooxydans]|uniref:tail fiber assembly protein n=1 Tax=Comamonas thiooxydans TaxID=363952 RepID=UPI001CCA4842|nr:tail fiber assembly protein [Comamonas thiooxydans]UBQ44574.1 phage tail assembly chaperone [Comamonas thiooxydans]
MKTLIRIGKSCQQKRLFEVTQYMRVADDIETPPGWIAFDGDFPGDSLSGLLYDKLEKRLTERPKQTHYTQVFDLDTCSWSVPVEVQWAEVRRERDRRMGLTDWRVTRAMEIGQALAPEWVAYRQALRDVPLQPDPFAIDWPSAPADESTEAPTEAQH